jgi:copper chaperone NosL
VRSLPVPAPTLLAAAALAIALAGAAQAAGPAAGEPAPRGCDYCRMRIEDPAFEGEITGERGRRWRFDAIECMAAAVLTDSVPPRAIRAIAARAVARPHAPLDVHRARFLHGPGLPSPMGMHLSAHASESAALAARRRHGGRLLDWRGVLATVDSLWFQGRLDVDRHARLPASSAQPRSVEASSRR